MSKARKSNTKTVDFERIKRQRKYSLGDPAGEVGRRVDVVPRHVLSEDRAKEHLAHPYDLPGCRDVQQIDREHGEHELEGGQSGG